MEYLHFLRLSWTVSSYRMVSVTPWWLLSLLILMYLEISETSSALFWCETYWRYPAWLAPGYWPDRENCTKGFSDSCYPRVLAICCCWRVWATLWASSDCERLVSCYFFLFASRSVPSRESVMRDYWLWWCCSSDSCSCSAKDSSAPVRCKPSRSIWPRLSLRLILIGLLWILGPCFFCEPFLLPLCLLMFDLLDWSDGCLCCFVSRFSALPI